MSRNVQINRGSWGIEMGWHTVQLDHLKVGDGDEVAHGSEAVSGRPDLLQKTAHGLHVGV